jgi:hypothetical protein
MTKTRLASALAVLSLVAAPSVALAHSGGHHHKRHGKHHAHKAKIRHVVRHDDASTTAPSTATPATTASVTSFNKANGELTITLSNGKAYTANVTDRTKLECEPAATPTARKAGDDGDDEHGRQDDNPGGRGRGDGDDDEHGDSEHGDGDHNDDGHEDNGQVKCDTSALTLGTVVTEADLKLSTAGATWKKVELVK